RLGPFGNPGRPFFFCPFSMRPDLWVRSFRSLWLRTGRVGSNMRIGAMQRPFLDLFSCCPAVGRRCELGEQLLTEDREVCPEADEPLLGHQRQLIQIESPIDLDLEGMDAALWAPVMLGDEASGIRPVQLYVIAEPGDLVAHEPRDPVIARGSEAV